MAGITVDLGWSLHLKVPVAHFVKPCLNDSTLSDVSTAVLVVTEVFLLLYLLGTQLYVHTRLCVLVLS